MEPCDNDIPGPSHGRPVLTSVPVNFENSDFENFIYSELDNPSEPDPYDSDKDPEFRIDSEHDSESEQEADETRVDDEEYDTTEEFFYGKKVKKKEQFKWKKVHPPIARTRRNNIVLQLPGLKAPAKQLGTKPTVEEVWGLLFTNDILDEVLQWTNRKISSVKVNYKKPQPYLCDLTIVELKAFIGLLIYTSIFKSSNESIDSFYATDGTGRDIFRCTMTRNRFLFLLLVLRFDNPDDRDERKKEDPTAAVSKIFEKFIANSRLVYSPGPTMCIDEMLVPFRGRCRFKMYMPKKPAKYGIKILCMTDARTHYVYNWYIYCGKGSDGKGLSDAEKNLLIPSQAVIKLAKPIEKTRRNITADNWFSSVELANELLKHDLTYVGTLKKNKTEIPPEFKPNKSREVDTSLYGFTDDLTLLSHVPKKSKAVILISSMHHSPEEDEPSGKPEIIAFYNLTKGGVDGVDQKCANYTSSRRTRRWPMVVFFTLVDVGCGVNSYILYQSYKDTKRLTRFDFMKTLANSLTHPFMAFRMEHTRYLPRQLVSTMKMILNYEDHEDGPNIPEFFEKRKTCSTCPPRLKRQTKYPCQKCGEAICLECAKKVCKTCFQTKE